MPWFKVTIKEWPFTTVVEAKDLNEAELMALGEYEGRHGQRFEPDYDVVRLKGRPRNIRRE